MAGDEVGTSVEGFTPELLDFYQASGLDRAEGGKDALDWRFKGADAPFCVIRRGREIVGLTAYIPSRFKLGYEVGSAFQAVDGFVASSMRGKGVFTELARVYAAYAANSGADLLWGFPNPKAAPAWFGKLGWTSHGQVPFLIRPLRAGGILRRLRLPGDFRLTSARDQNLQRLDSVGAWVDELWECFAASVGCGTMRDRSFIEHRLFNGPSAGSYRTVGIPDRNGGIVATREITKHGGRIAYLMEAMGAAALEGLLRSELGRLCDNGTELVLAWSYPWSPNYSTLRKCGFMPLPQFARPIEIWFGSRGYTKRAQLAADRAEWYLSYLDSDTI